MPLIANFTAWIQVDGEALPEYRIRYSDDGRQATCWIPSELSKHFAICVGDSERSYTSATTVYVDGTHCTGKIIYGKATHPRRPPISSQHGIKISDGSYRQFVFSKCNLIEDEDVKNIEDTTRTIVSSEVGSIKVEVHEVNAHDHVKVGYILHELPPLQVNEKVKKGIVHGTQLGAEVRSKTRRPRKTSKIRHIATFLFQYRPFAVLQAAGLAPAPTSSGRVDHSAIDSHDAVVKKEEDISSHQSAQDLITDLKTEVKTEDSELKGLVRLWT